MVAATSRAREDGRPVRRGVAPGLIAFAIALGGASAAPAQQLAYTGPRDDPVAVAVRDHLAATARDRRLGFVDLAESPPAPSRAPGLCAAGIRAYQQLDLEAAERSLDQCLAEIGRTGGAGLSPRQIADAHVYRAMVAIERQQAERARDQLIAAATVSPGYALDQARFRPSLVASFERARAAVAGAAPAVVELELPDRCDLRIDGAESTGVSALSLRPGRHYLAIRCEGFEPFAAAPTFQSPRQRYRPPLVARLPDRQRVLAATGARWILWARLDGSVLELRRLVRGEADGARRWRVEIASPARVDRIDPIVDSLVARPEPRLPERPAAPLSIRRRWYQRPWVWIAAGALAGAAIAVPFALAGDGGGGFRVVPEGVP